MITTSLSVGGRVLPSGHQLLPLQTYDLIIVSFSGGKDSVACLLHLIELGVPPEKIELWHQCVDGDPDTEHLMDWPITPGYCRALAESLGIPLRMQWKVGGFEREMLRQNERTAPTVVDLPTGKRSVGGTRGKPATRRMFPQVSADLSVRWCSAYLKIDVATKQVTNHPRFRSGRLLYVSGERREESAARARYQEAEPHRTCNQRRRVDHWRPIIDWLEAQVWAILERHRINPHPCYHLGWGRCSCLACIFGNDDQWASVRDLAPHTFQRIADHERAFGKTIHRRRTVIERADRGTSYLTGKPGWLRRLAMGRAYPPDLIRTDPWRLPEGAFRRDGGPS